MPLPERSLIAQIRRMAAVGGHPRWQAGHGLPSVVAGIGDDCSVLRFRPSDDILVTTDFSIEGVHFRRDWHSAEVVGHRCLTRGLSDIAAMGGQPVAVFLSLAVPRTVSQVWVRAFFKGLLRLAKKHGAPLAGGDTAESSSGIIADIIVVGAVPKGKALMRSGAKPGDRIFVSGELGGSAAAIAEMRRHPRKRLSPGQYRRHFFPQARIEIGRTLREKRIASALIDTSDGLSVDLAHLCEESAVGAQLEAGLIPRARVGKPLRDVTLDLALHGGEDYELLFTVPRSTTVPSRIDGIPLVEIGEITRSRKIVVRDSDGALNALRPGGWEHFRREIRPASRYFRYQHWSTEVCRTGLQ
jgi:thiamine-monophosphate kinase